MQCKLHVKIGHIYKPTFNITSAPSSASLSALDFFRVHHISSGLFSAFLSNSLIMILVSHLLHPSYHCPLS